MRNGPRASLLRRLHSILSVTLVCGAVSASLSHFAAAKSDATRSVVLSLQGIDRGGCFAKIDTELKKLKGVVGAVYDTRTVEATVEVRDNVRTQKLVDAVERAGFLALEGSGQGRWLPPRGFPEGSDVGIVVEDGSDVDLEGLAVPGKVTLVDFYADWCGPCRMMDEAVISALQKRTDIAVRKINIVNWKTPVVQNRGAELRGIPYLVVFGKKAQRVATVRGYRPRELDLAIEQGAAQ